MDGFQPRFIINRKLLLFLWIADIVLVGVGSLLPPGALHRIHYTDLPLNDKFVHFGNYAILGLLPAMAFDTPCTSIICGAAMVLIGISLEFLQRLVPGRSFEVGDMVANGLGVTAGLLLALVVRRYIPRRTHPLSAEER